MTKTFQTETGYVQILLKLRDFDFFKKEYNLDMEGDIIPYQFEEVAGKETVGVPMTENQAYYLHEYIDPEVERLIAGLEMEKVRRQLADEYMRRTIPELK